MNARLVFGGAVLAASTTLTLATPSMAGVDTPPETGCPGGAQLLVVVDLLELGYMVPAVVDAEGNENGLVCGAPVSERVQEKFCEDIGGCTVDVIYRFRDDDLPALKP